MSEGTREGRSNAGAYIAIAIGIAVVLLGLLAIVAWFGVAVPGSSSTVVLSAPALAPVAPAATPTPAPAAEDAPQPEQK